MTPLNWGIRLLTMHLLFIALVWLASYFWLLDLAFAAFYVYVIWQSGIRIKEDSLRQRGLSLFIAGLVAQFPGMVLAALSLTYYLGKSGAAGDCTYAFQLWHTPFLPFLTFFTFRVYQGFISYYAALFFLSPLYIALLALPHIIERREKRPRLGSGKTAA